MQTACSIFSNLFRFVSYVFLRVIPFGLGKFVLPALYASYLLCLCLSTPFTRQEAITEEKTEEKTDETKPTPAEVESNKPLSQALILLFSLPTQVRRLRLASLAINSLLFLAAVDLVAEPYLNDASDVVYTRVGAVYHDAVKIAIRYPTITEPIHVVWRRSRARDNSQPWTVGPSVNLSQEHDWVSTVTLSQLWPSTAYEYTLSVRNGSALPYPSKPIHFQTFPDPRLHYGAKFRFMVSSCIKPNFPYAPLQGNRIKGFDLLAKYLWPDKVTASAHTGSDENSTNTEANLSDSHNDSEVVSAPLESFSSPAEFMLFLGDFVYADVPLYFGDNKEAYRRLYRRNYQSKSFRKVYERLPIIHAYDDHEIINNFAGQSTDGAPFQNAVDPFRLYNSQANYDSPDADQHYYDFTYGSDAAFFVMDTRRHRSKVEQSDPISRTMLGDNQLATFYSWLSKVNSTVTFKFIVTSVPFTSLWTHDALVDSWAAYEHEKSTILEALSTVPNVIILSGDRHEFAAIEFNGQDASSYQAVEFSTSPMSMFYIPLLRTLNLASEDTVPRTRQEVKTTDDGIEVVQDVVEHIPKERVLKYLPTGNYKWSSIEVDTKDQDHPVVHVEVHIDGTVQHRQTVTGVPVKRVSSLALGALIPQGFKDVFDKFGLKPNKWF